MLEKCFKSYFNIDHHYHHQLQPTMSNQNRRLSGSSSEDSEDGLPPQHVDLAADEEWEDAEPDEESLTAVSLFSDKRFTGVDAVMQVILHDASEHGFDVREVVNRLGGYAHC